MKLLENNQELVATLDGVEVVAELVEPCTVKTADCSQHVCGCGPVPLNANLDASDYEQETLVYQRRAQEYQTIKDNEHLYKDLRKDVSPLTGAVMGLFIGAVVGMLLNSLIQMESSVTYMAIIGALLGGSVALSKNYQPVDDQN